MIGQTPRWEHFEHRTDIGVAGYGATAAEAFEQAALALTAILCDPAAVAPAERVEIRCEAPDLELLLVDRCSSGDSGHNCRKATVNGS